ncbi:hypothetical protein BDN71DRAFT_1398751, partial [Pleurotus eryngii]
MAEFEDVSLTDFISRYTQIMEYEDDPNIDRDLITFGLTGIDPETETRYRLNMVNNYRLRDDSGIPNMTRDYDSFIGFTDHIPITRDLYLYALPPHHISTIAQSMHLKIPFHTSTGVQDLDPSQVPNVLLGKYNDRHQLRIFFPSLWSATRISVKLTGEEAEMLYNEILQPTVATVAPALAKDWPTSLEAERFRSKTSRSAYQHTAYILNANLIGAFKHEFNHRLQAHESFNHAVFCTHIQGIKASTMHEMSALSADIALTKMLEDFDTHRGLWWVDVGIEIQDGERAILWRKDAAPNLLSYVFARVQVSSSTIPRWRKAFEVCFPPKGHTTPKSSQTWTHMRYYMDWKTLVGSLQPNDADTVREALWHEFKNLTWIPCATSERPWRTDKQPLWTQLP